MNTHITFLAAIVAAIAAGVAHAGEPYSDCRHSGGEKYDTCIHGAKYTEKDSAASTGNPHLFCILQFRGEFVSVEKAFIRMAYLNKMNVP